MKDDNVSIHEPFGPARRPPIRRGDTRRTGCYSTAKYIFTVFDSRKTGSYSSHLYGGQAIRGNEMSQIIFRAAYSAVYRESPTPKGRVILFPSISRHAGNERFPVLCHTTPTGLRCALAGQTWRQFLSIASAFSEVILPKNLLKTRNVNTCCSFCTSVDISIC